MTAQSNILENRLVDGLFRGGAMNSSGTLNSSAVVTGIWTASTAINAGEFYVPHANMTGAGGKLLLCEVAGTTGTNNALAIPAVGSTLTDGGVTWRIVSVIPAYYTLYFALMTTAPTDAGGGVEVSGGNYSRVAVLCSLANLAGTQSAGSTTASTGTGGTTSNNTTLQYPTASASWGTVVAIAVYDRPTGGNLIDFGNLAASKAIASGDAPFFAAGDYTFQVDN